MKMKQVALAIALAFGSTVAFAGDKAAKPEATGDKAVTTTPTPQQGQPAGSSVGDDTAGAFWTEHARGGYMTKEQAMGYKMQDGQTMDFKKMDSDADGRISQSEWDGFHTSFSHKDGGPAEAKGAAGPTAK